MRPLKKILLPLSLLWLVMIGCSSVTNHTDENDEIINEKVNNLLKIMTLQEKVGQMLNIGLPSLLEGPFYSYRDTLIFDDQKVQTLLVEYGAGSVQNLGSFPLTPEQWNYYIGKIQEINKNQTRLGIPILYGIDAVHGANYSAGSILFPHQINLAASFNVDLAKQVGEMTSYELRACTIPWNYSPVLDVARHSRWGRIFESFGEDTYMVDQMGQAMFKGAQGDSPAEKDKTLQCAKHFVGYGASYNGKDRSPVMLSENYIRQVLLPPFETAIKNGLLTIMISSGSLNGTPSHIDKNLITKILKNELHFKGFVISDWNDIDNLYLVHKVAKDEREAVKLSVLAGLDMCMEPYDASFAKHLISLVNDGEVPISRINDAVRRILYVKYKVGLFNGVQTTTADYPEHGSAKSDSINLSIAEETLVLLKNDTINGDKKGILPLNKNTRVLVTGVASNSINYLNGGWSRTWSGQDTSYNDKDKLSILDAIKEKAGAQNVLFAKGTGYTDGDYIQEAVKKAAQADVIVACIGEKPATEKPSDIDELAIPDIQLELIQELAKTRKPIVLVMVQGRPRIIRRIEPLAKCILMAFLPGNEGGRAIANTIYGQSNPSAKLPYTYPRYEGSLWTYDHQLSDERDVNFGLNGFTPQYEFGYGLSYTHFNYSPITISNDTLQTNDTLKISFKVSNTGKLAGKEAVLLFVSDEVASIAPPVKQLKRFTKIELQPDETKKVVFTISKSDLQFVNQNNEWICEPGYFTISIQNQKARFYLNN